MIAVNQLTGINAEELSQIGALAEELRGGVTAEPALEDVEIFLTNPDIVVIVARDGATIVGMGTLYILPKFGKRISHIEDVVVSTHYQNQGIGRRIMESLIEAAKTRNVSYITLTSRPERIAARSLYESLGFKKRETDVFKLAL